jgi:hypothetical protein
LKVQIPFRVPVAGQVLEVPVLLEEFGAERGMLLVTVWGDIALLADDLVAQGFGCSCLQESDASAIDESVLADMLQDWGWTGSTQPPEPVAALLSSATGAESH